jgi:hypothetical protein
MSGLLIPLGVFLFLTIAHHYETVKWELLLNEYAASSPRHFSTFNSSRPKTPDA